jgi:deoxyribonuclease-4
LERAAKIGAMSCQIFVKNNMQWSARRYTSEEIETFRRAWAGSECRQLFGHTGYLINVAAPPSVNRDRSIQSLILEVELAAQLSLPFLVLHPGAHLGQGEVEGLRHAVRALDEVFKATRGLPVRIALENTAGQGSCLGHEWRHLEAIYDGVRAPDRLGLCIDTAHCFAAGHDLRTPAGWESILAEVDKRVGLAQVLAFHLNDSKTELGSRVDRHAGIGQGKIGRAAFRHIVNDPRFVGHPGCLETPKSADLHEDVENLAILASLAGGAVVPLTGRKRAAAGGPRRSKVQSLRPRRR